VDESTETQQKFTIVFPSRRTVYECTILGCPGDEVLINDKPTVVPKKMFLVQYDLNGETRKAMVPVSSVREV